MQLKSLILIGLVFVGCLLVVFYSNKEEDKKQDEALDDRELLIFDQNQVEELVIENASGKVVCRKVGEDWQIVEPLILDAHRGAVQTVLVNLSRARLKRFLPLDEADGAEVLSKYGLDQPHVKVSLRDGERLLGPILFGDKNPSGKYVYVKKDSENRIGMVELYRRTGVDKSVAELRTKDALKFKQAEVVNFRIETSLDTLIMVKIGEEWRMQQPLEVRGDKEAIESFLKTFIVKKFIDDAPKDIGEYGLSSPQARVDIGLEGNRVHSLLIGAKRQGHYCAKDAAKPAIFSLDSTFVNQLNRASFDLRYKKLLAFDRKNIDRVEFASQDSTYICVREKDIWLKMPQKQPVAAKEFEAVLFNIEKLKASEFLHQTQQGHKRHGLDSPHLRIRLWSGAEEVGELALGAKEGDKVYARGSANEVVSLVDEAAIESLQLERIFVQN